MFSPKDEPARSLYLALLGEMEHRKDRSVEEWIDAERHAVMARAVVLAEKFRLKAPTLEEVVTAETLAYGHADYAAKFSSGVAEIMRKPPQS